MSRSRPSATQSLQSLLPKSMVDQLSAMANNGHGSLPLLLTRVIDLGLKRLAELDGQANGSPAELAPRQIAVLECLRNGYAVGEIAAILSISETTVRTHITRIKERLGCHDLLELRLPARNHLEPVG